eukprot:478028-Rhodomonas_salina.2
MSRKSEIRDCNALHVWVLLLLLVVLLVLLVLLVLARDRLLGLGTGNQWAVGWDFLPEPHTR